MLGKLTDTAVKNAKPKEKPYKLADASGMYLLVTPKGQKWWRLDFRLNGKRKTLSLGVYPDVKLKKARIRRQDAREAIADGVDPSDIRKKKKAALEGADTFKTVAEEWHKKYLPKWTPTYAEDINARLTKYVYPWLGNNTVDTITASDLLRVLRRVEEKGAHETAHKLRRHCGQIFRYAIVTGRADRDPSQDLKGALAPVKTRHFASIIEPEKIGQLLRAIGRCKGQIVTRCALKFAPLVFVRPGELRKAEWDEIDFDNAEWRIPAQKMKMDRPHIVPLSTQALEVLKELEPLTSNGRYVFPNVRTRHKPMSENTLNNALGNMGYSGDEMVAHGFRSMASTRLNEMGWNRDAIERQLAHVEGNAVRAAYNYAEHLDIRIQMMQAWADYLDALCSGADIVALRKVAG